MENREENKRVVVPRSEPKPTGERSAPRSAVRHYVATTETIAEKNRVEEDETLVRTKGSIDKPLLIVILLILALGSMMVFSASYPYANYKFNDSTHFIQRQLTFAIMGIIVMILAAMVPYKVYRKLAWVGYIISFVLLILVLLFGSAEGVAKRWLTIPFINQTFQPSEIAKLTLILTLARYLSGHRTDYLGKTKETRKTRFFYGVLIPLLILGTVAGLVLLEKHLSGTLIIGVIGISMLILAGTPFLQSVITYGSLGTAAGLFFIFNNDYALTRITSFLSGIESSEMTDERWQTLHGLWAIGSGGFLGLGVGGSRLKYMWVSQAYNDFIFTIWCEETGFVGAILLIGLYGFFIWRGLRIALRAPDYFSVLTAFGITIHIATQVILNIAVVTDLIPNTGISLPLFSYGGTSLVLIMFEMGILLSISRHSYERTSL